jgi:3-isopropylmalate/(R)-2-methylmalate dehydratase small subunit
VHKLGDNINTDYILSSRRKRDTLDLNVLKKYLMEDINPEFAGRVKAGDILVAGVNFGCGSAMEVASLVVKAAGIRVIVARSFARTYYRNAINGGLLTIEAETGSIADQDRLRIEVGSKRIAIHNLTKDRTITADLPGGLILDLFEAGGLVDYIRRNGDFPSK